MAERRMFTQKIIDSDAFLDMPLSAQALYFHLNMRADDDGFVNNPKRIQRTIGAAEDDLKLLLAKRFIIGFDNGVIVIKHWRMHNTLRKDRYNPTQYQEEFARLEVKENNSYTERLVEIPPAPVLTSPVIESVATTRQPPGNHLEPQYRLGKDSIDQYREGKGNDSDESAPLPAEIQKVSCQQIVDLYHSICVSFPKVRALSAARKKAINARLNTYSLDDIKAVFENAEASEFLKGKNDRNWQANFDWLLTDKNMVKVLEGNYADKPSRYGRKEKLPDWFQPSGELGQAELDAIQRILNEEQKRPLDVDEILAVKRMLAEDEPMSEDDQAEADQLRAELQEAFGGNK